jgi:hypothetical protein
MKKSAFIFLAMALTVLMIASVLGSACGPKQTAPQPQTPSSPGGNRAPVISNLTAAKLQVYPSGTTEIQCVASDPDGDRIDFQWNTTGGSFSGAGPTVIWQAPKNYGTYTVVVIVSDGKGGSSQSSLNLAVSANQNPIISSFSSNPSTILYGGSTTLTCVATDPEGDVVRYSWTASEGNITGVGDKVTWVAPNKGGEFTVIVVVSDGKGGETRGDIKITVTTATRMITITPVTQETGSVSSDGDKDNSRTWAGDDEKNVGYSTFWSYDIWSLQGANIENAKLKFTTRNRAGDPFSMTTGLKGLRLWNVKYGDKLPSFQYTGNTLERGGAVFTSPPVEVDVTPEIGNLAKAAATRFQVEALFMNRSNGNNVAEWIDWSNVVLEVTYTEK